MVVSRLWLLSLCVFDVGCSDDASSGGRGATGSGAGPTDGGPAVTDGASTSREGGSADAASGTAGGPTGDMDASGDTDAGDDAASIEAASDLYLMTRNTPWGVDGSFGVLRNDSDADGAALTVVASEATLLGEPISIAADGAVSYTPSLTFGYETIAYSVSNGAGTTEAEVTLAIRPINVAADATLDHPRAFSMFGEAPDQRVYPAPGGPFGDINGDGLADIVLHTTQVSAAGGQGRAYVVFGKSDGANIALSDVSGGLEGFMIESGPDDGPQGMRMYGVGDVNGDGLADIAVGPSTTPVQGLTPGRAYVVFGKGDAMPVYLSDVAQGLGGFLLSGEVAGDYTGFGIAGGDINGDGLSDIVLETMRPFFGPGWGRTYVVFGKNDTNPVDLNMVAGGVGGFIVTREGSIIQNARTLGDLDGDGFDDLALIIGSTGYVVFGKADGTQVDLDQLDGAARGYRIMPEPAAQTGTVQIVAPGDFDGDGLPDLAIGYGAADGLNQVAGRVYLVLGKTDETEILLADIAAGEGGVVVSGAFYQGFLGFSVRPLGDFDGDGLADLVMSEFGYGGFEAPPYGRALVLLGTEFPRSLSSPSIAAGDGGFAIHPSAGGILVAPQPTGDVDGDGLDDFIYDDVLYDNAAGRVSLFPGQPMSAPCPVAETCTVGPAGGRCQTAITHCLLACGPDVVCPQTMVCTPGGVCAYDVSAGPPALVDPVYPATIGCAGASYAPGGDLEVCAPPCALDVCPAAQSGTAVPSCALDPAASQLRCG